MQARSGARLESRSITSHMKASNLYIHRSKITSNRYTFHHVSVSISRLPSCELLLVASLDRLGCVLQPQGDLTSDRNLIVVYQPRK